MKKRTFMAIATSPLLFLGMVIGFVIYPLYAGFMLGFEFFEQQMILWVTENKNQKDSA